MVLPQLRAVGAPSRPRASGHAPSPVVASPHPTLPCQRRVSVVAPSSGGWPVGVPVCAVAVVGSGLERAGGESLGSACRPMTTMPSGAVYLIEGVIFTPFPPSPACLPSENLDHVGQTTTAPVALFPSWRRCLGSFASGGHLLSSESFCFCACLCFISSASSGSRLVVGFSSLANALPPFRPGGCFAVVSGLADALTPSSHWLKFVSGGCFVAVVDGSGGCFATFVRPLTFVPWMLLFLLAGSVVGFWLEEWVVFFVFSVLFCCCSCCRCIFSFVCTFF